MKNKNLPIGIFDSGVGGLTVLKEMIRVLPCEDVIYLGDTAHLPYGTKSKETITKLSISNILFLLAKKVKFIIVACNSTSSVALPQLANFFGVPVEGVVEAGVEQALGPKLKRIGIIGTPATIRSSSYQNLIKKNIPGAKVIARACPLFVPLVEEGWIDSEVTQIVAQVYLGGLNGKIDLLILGCTHYPLLKKVISKILPGVRLIDSAEAVVKKTKKMLSRAGLLKKRGTGKISFFLTDNSPNFSRLAKLILKRGFKPVIIEDV